MTYWGSMNLFMDGHKFRGFVSPATFARELMLTGPMRLCIVFGYHFICTFVILVLHVCEGLAGVAVANAVGCTDDRMHSGIFFQFLVRVGFAGITAATVVRVTDMHMRCAYSPF